MTDPLDIPDGPPSARDATHDAVHDDGPHDDGPRSGTSGDDAPAPGVEDPWETDPPGAGVVNATFAATGALVVAAAAGAASPDDFGLLTAGVSVALFALGTAGMLWGYATGVVRSRDEAIGLGGLFFLSGTAPRLIRFRLRVAFAVQVVASVAAATLRPYTAVAFAVLAPMAGLGAMAAWGARHGRFRPRDDPRRSGSAS